LHKNLFAFSSSTIKVGSMDLNHIYATNEIYPELL